MGKTASTNRKKSVWNYKLKYGSMNREERMTFVSYAFIEFGRILKNDGVVLFKWNTCGTKLERIMSVIHGFVPMFGQNFNRIKTHETVWLCFRKDLDGKQKVIE